MSLRLICLAKRCSSHTCVVTRLVISDLRVLARFRRRGGDSSRKSTSLVREFHCARSSFDSLFHPRLTALLCESIFSVRCSLATRGVSAEASRAFLAKSAQQRHKFRTHEASLKIMRRSKRYRDYIVGTQCDVYLM
jgi:hypothetical protein